MTKKTKDTITGMSPFNEAKYQAEDDLRTLTRAIEIRKDPKRMKAAQSLAKEKLAEYASVAADKDK